MPTEVSFSIITVLLNAQDHLQRTIDSVYSQSVVGTQYIVIDGHSIDKSVEIIKDNASKISEWVSEPDKGIYDAMNKGLVRASNDWIGIINAGDFYFPWTLQVVSDAIQQHPGAEIIHGNQLRIEEYETFSFFRVQQPRLSSKHIRDGPNIFHPTCFVKREVYEKIGVFDPSFRVDADYEFLLRADRAGISFHYVPKLLAGFQSGGVSGGCRRFSEGYKILWQYGINRYISNTMKLLECLGIRVVAKFINLKARLERKRLKTCIKGDTTKSGV